jgi:fumarate hydratase subunit beta
VSAVYHLDFPISHEQVRVLRAGDFVYLNGEIVITAGLPTHRRIFEYLDAGTALPIDLTGAALLHLGSYCRETNGKFEILYINPTTSTRFNPFMPRLIRRFGLCAVGGKGGLDADCARVMQDVGCVYLSFLGGSCTLLSEAIREVISVGWNDLIPHYRVARLRVEELGPATVGIDAHGASIYDQLKDEAQRRLPAIMADLDKQRGHG